MLSFIIKKLRFYNINGYNLTLFIAEPRTRPKLNLAPRTKPIENQPAPARETNSPPPSSAAPPPPQPSGVPAASIFGNAKPVDTSARERQIEERLAKESEKPPLSRDSSLDGRSRRYVSIVLDLYKFV